MPRTTYPEEVLHLVLGQEHLVSARINGTRRFIATSGHLTDYPTLANGHILWNHPERWTPTFLRECAAIILPTNLALVQRTYNHAHPAQ